MSNNICSSFTQINAIAEILSDMDAEITALEAKLSTVREIKQGMMSVLLTPPASAAGQAVRVRLF